MEAGFSEITSILIAIMCYLEPHFTVKMAEAVKVCQHFITVCLFIYSTYIHMRSAGMYFAK
jgi:hypothetical protein